MKLSDEQRTRLLLMARSLFTEYDEINLHDCQVDVEENSWHIFLGKKNTHFGTGKGQTLLGTPIEGSHFPVLEFCTVQLLKRLSETGVYEGIKDTNALAIIYFKNCLMPFGISMPAYPGTEQKEHVNIHPVDFLWEWFQKIK